MGNEIKLFIDDEYKNIYANLIFNWRKCFKNKIEEINHNGLVNSGIEQRILTDYAIELVNSVNEKIKSLLKNSQEKFSFVMQSKDIEDYINKSINNNKSLGGGKGTKEFQDILKEKFIEQYSLESRDFYQYFAKSFCGLKIPHELVLLCFSRMQ